MLSWTCIKAHLVSEALAEEAHVAHERQAVLRRQGPHERQAAVGRKTPCVKHERRTWRMRDWQSALRLLYCIIAPHATASDHGWLLNASTCAVVNSPSRSSFTSYSCPTHMPMYCCSFAVAVELAGSNSKGHELESTPSQSALPCTPWAVMAATTSAHSAEERPA